MHKFHVLSLVCFIGSIFCFSIAFLQGDLHVGIVVIIPILIGSGFWPVFGFFCLFLSFLFYSYGFFHDEGKNHLAVNHETEYEAREATPHMKTKGILLIGPIPIIFGLKKKKTLYLGIFLIIIIMLIIVLFTNHI